MAKTPRAWTALDQEAMSYIATLRERDPRKLSLRAIEELTGISHSRIADLLKGRMGSPSLQEFTTLCLLFGERPSRVLERVMQTVERTEPTTIEHTTNTTALADGVAPASDATETEPDWLAMAAKHGDIDAEQEAYEELP